MTSDLPPAETKPSVTDLYKRHGPVIYRRCLRLLKNPDAARDATQEVFLKMVLHAAKLDGNAMTLPWMYRVATNHCLNWRRNARSHGEEHLEPDLDIAPVIPTDVYPDRALAQAILSRFDAATQAVAVAVFVDGMEREEVAAALGVSRRTVARKLERFLASARKFIAASAARDAAQQRGGRDEPDEVASPS